MEQRNVLLGMFFLILVVFGGLVAYDMYSNNRLSKIMGTDNKSNWEWEDNWNGQGPKPNQPTQPNPNQPTQPPARRKIVASDYQDALKKSGELGMPVLIYFEASWCKWCTKMKNETLTDSQVRLVMKNYIMVYVDTDKDRRIGSKFGVRSLPSYVITNYREANLKKGQGYQDGSKFESWLNNPSLYKQPKANQSSPDQRRPDNDNRRPRWPRNPGG